MILDDGGDLTNLIHEKYPKYLEGMFPVYNSFMPISLIYSFMPISLIYSFMPISLIYNSFNIDVPALSVSGLVAGVFEPSLDIDM